MGKKKEKQDIEHLGEFGLIRLLTKNIKLGNKSSEKGVGDDAAILDMKGMKTVVTSDILTEGVHFDLVYTPLKHLGYKAVIVNLSDVYAMNAKPTQILVSIALSSKFSAEMIEEIYEGIHLACSLYNVDLVGGDTTSSMTGLTISITAIGSVSADKITFRSGAKKDDLICVSGDLGASYMGLQLLEREKKVFEKSGNMQPDFSGYDYLLERQLKPEARNDIIKLLADKKIKPTSMIDISDGLSSEILHICDASNAGCKIYIDKIPVAQETKKMAEELNMEPISASMNGGEDYELLFTVPLTDYDKISSMEGISVIGHITGKKDGKYMVMPDGSMAEIMALGWNSLLE
jgi:thiamine-monophosphate kinase